MVFGQNLKEAKLVRSITNTKTMAAFIDAHIKTQT